MRGESQNEQVWNHIPAWNFPLRTLLFELRFEPSVACKQQMSEEIVIPNGKLVMAARKPFGNLVPPSCNSTTSWVASIACTTLVRRSCSSMIFMNTRTFEDLPTPDMVRWLKLASYFGGVLRVVQKSSKF